MRLFVAVNLPKREKDRIFRAARPLRERELPVKWVQPDRYHVSLKFLGEVQESRLDDVEGALEKVSASTAAMDLEVSGFGAFPTIRRPSVLWVGIEPSPALRCLKQDVEWALSTCGFDRETRAFHPHITLGRADPEDGAGAFRGLDQLAADLDYEGEIKVRKVDLMRSHLSKDGAHYSVFSSAALKG
jgi:RNA 2',3'-cyclic 3'-phosphodiesterase